MQLTAFVGILLWPWSSFLWDPHLDKISPVRTVCISPKEVLSLAFSCLCTFAIVNAMNEKQLPFSCLQKWFAIFPNLVRNTPNSVIHNTFQVKQMEKCLTFQFGNLRFASAGSPKCSLSFSVSWFQGVCSAILATREFPCSESSLFWSGATTSAILFFYWAGMLSSFFSLLVWAWYAGEKAQLFLIRCVC